jgi:hypothetical protein
MHVYRTRTDELNRGPTCINLKAPLPVGRTRRSSGPPPVATYDLLPPSDPGIPADRGGRPLLRGPALPARPP